LLAVLILLPVFAVLLRLGEASPEWGHLSRTVLPGYLGNTLVLVVATVALSLLLSVLPAWLVTTCEFPGRRLLSWTLVLPLAIPTYVAAFVYYQIPEAAIPLLVRIRQSAGVDAFLAAELVLRYSLLVLMLAAVLQPYVYLACRAAFARQGRLLIEASRCLGDSPRRAFFGVALPLARPAMVAGSALVAMEVVNDYGAVHFFGVPTLTEGIFRTWFGMGDKVAALRIAGILVLAVTGLLVLEQALRGRARYACPEGGDSPLQRLRLSPAKALAALAVCLVPLALGFLYPVARLGHWAWLHLSSAVERAPWDGAALGRGFALALGTAFGATLLAAIFAYAARLRETRYRRLLLRSAGIGYAMPGAVVALGVLAVLGAFDRLSIPFLPMLGGTLFAISFAYTARFFAVPLQLAKAGMDRLGKPLEEASRLLGSPPLETFLRIDLPLLRAPLVAGGMLLFVDILKELPLTLILRPVNFETLATRAYSLASEARLQACAIPALLIVAAGAAGLLIMNRWLQPSSNDER